MALAVCALLAVGYWLGGRRAVRVVDAPRRWSARQWRATVFAMALVLIVLLVAEPVDALFRQTFWLRTAQLMLLVMLAAPLAIVGAPLPRWRRLLLGESGRGPNAPSKLGALIAFALFNGALVLTYLPPVYRLTAAPGWARQLAQVLLFGAGVWFWSEVIAQPPRRCALTHVERIFYLFLSSALVRILGLILGFASVPFYKVPMVEQQLAAGILLVPGVLTDLIVLTVCLYLFLAQDARQASQRFPDSDGARSSLNRFFFISST